MNRWMVSATTLAACGLISHVAGATLPVPCGGPFVTAVPAPVAAGDAAILLLPSHEIDSRADFAVAWFDPNGEEVLFDLALFDSTSYYHLRPQTPVDVGVHTLVYSENCGSPPAPPKQIDVVFESVRRPPAQLGTLTASYEPHCPRKRKGSSGSTFLRRLP